MQREWLFGTFLGVQWKQFWTSLAQEIDVHDIVISSFHQIAIDLVNVAACQGVSEQAETQNPSISHIHADETTDALLYVNEYMATLSCLLMSEMCGARCRDEWPWTVLVWEPQLSPTK